MSKREVKGNIYFVAKLLSYIISILLALSITIFYWKISINMYIFGIFLYVFYSYFIIPKVKTSKELFPIKDSKMSFGKRCTRNIVLLHLGLLCYTPALNYAIGDLVKLIFGIIPLVFLVILTINLDLLIKYDKVNEEEKYMAGVIKTIDYYKESLNTNNEQHEQ